MRVTLNVAKQFFLSRHMYFRHKLAVNISTGVRVHLVEVQKSQRRDFCESVWSAVTSSVALRQN